MRDSKQEPAQLSPINSGITRKTNKLMLETTALGVVYHTAVGNWNSALQTPSGDDLHPILLVHHTMPDPSVLAPRLCSGHALCLLFYLGRSF